MATTIPLNAAGVTDYIQSGFLHLDAAGSDGSDNSAHGNHLRWQLLGNLGRKHLPKGTLSNSGTYATTIAYNRNNDYVTLFRAEYQVDQFRTAVDLINTAQDTIVDSGDTREWHYEGIVPVAAVTANTNTIIVSFLDITQYDYWAGVYDPTTDPENFLKNYSGIIQAWVVDKLCLSAWITTSIIDEHVSAYVYSEGIAVPDTTDNASKILSCRKTVTDIHATQTELRGENLESIRFSYSNLYPTHLSFQCYYDYIIGVNTSSLLSWTKVDDYSLELSDTVIADRLENTSYYTIDQTWPRYYGSNPSTGEYTVKVSNYTDKWAASGEGVLEAVTRYLDKSRTDVFALDALESDTTDDLAQYDISYLETIKLISLDFHFARMFGLGCIDTPEDSSTYVYVATFKTTKDPADETTSLNTLNVFMSLPVNETTYRLPVAPILKPITYGLSINNATGNPAQLSDEYGYGLYDDVRFVNLNKEPYPYDQPVGIFYESSTDFFSADVSKPVLFGVKYMEDSEGVWRSPELSVDEDYFDAADIEEVVPFPETDGTLFMHMETEEGIHDYAIYGVNLFSRVSDLSTTQVTNETFFPVRNTLLPPSNFQIQLVQSETPVLLTTTAEQTALAAISGADKTLVRATFEWNESQNIAYQSADKVDFYFCDHAPLTVRGVITSVTNASDNHAEVELGALTITSSDPSETIDPTIDSGDVSRFVGSQLAAGQQLFQVESVVTSGSTPVLLIKKIRQTQSQEYPIGSNQFITTESYLAPFVGDIIMLVENMADTANWSTHLAKQVSIIDFTPRHYETITLADGNQRTFYYGGVYKTNAVIDQIFDSFAPTTPTGLYKITFASYSLPTITDTDVEWYKGSVRALSTGSPSIFKKLQVWNIVQNGSNLELTVFDPDISSHPIVSGSNAQRTGVKVNFHPGYKVYLYKDDAGSNDFTDTAILPSTGTGSRITYMGTRSMDTTLSTDIFSPLSVPVPLYAREIVIPVAPTAMNGPQYATRPDFYGKSTYTFDAQLDTTSGRVPFGLIFFRGNDRLVLSTLYNAETLATVLSDLEGLTGDDADNYEQRILDVINGEINTTTGAFNSYGTGTYVLPDPDNDDLQIPDPANNDQLITPFDGSYTLADLATDGILQDAVAHAFQPLTEQPVIFQYLKSGTKTSPKKPLFRDENGQMIPPVLPSESGYDPDVYDPFPMVVTYTDSGDTFVRFTDYTLDGASKNVYFYYAIEFSNTNTFSDRSPLLGSVRLVNAYPADTPQIRKVTTQLADSSQLIDTAVLFEINSYLPSDGIGEYWIYRAINKEDALNVRTMSLATTIAVGDPLIDDFSDVAFPLYGEVLYYRIVAVRITKDENGDELKVPSQPSNIAITNVVDVINPEAPQLRSINGTTTSTELQEVILKWSTTAYNATYVLQKQSANGSWREIYRIKSNDPMQYPPLDLSNDPDFTNYPETETLERVDDNGDKVRNAFRVQVINSSGLLNLAEKELVLDQGAGDLLWYNAFVSFEDHNGYLQSELASADITYQNYQQPDNLIFTGITGDLPAGHNTFTSIVIEVADDLGNSYIRTISSPTGTVTFNNNDGGLVLDNSDPNRTYTITTTLKTDGAPDGAVKKYVLAYVAGACYDLRSLTSIVKYTDSTHDIDPLVSGDVNDGVAYPDSMTFESVVNLSSLGQLFDSIDVTVVDNYGNSDTKTIDGTTTQVTFNHGDGGLQLNSSNLNVAYRIIATLFTDLCTSGISYSYNLLYTYNPCGALLTLNSICSFSDSNSNSLNPVENAEFISGADHPDDITISEVVSGILPFGHSFQSITVSLQDDLNGLCIKTINSTSGSVSFTDTEGGLHLSSADPNRQYLLGLTLYTDLCTGGVSYYYLIKYNI